MAKTLLLTFRWNRRFQVEPTLAFPDGNTINVDWRVTTEIMSQLEQSQRCDMSDGTVVVTGTMRKQ